MFGGLTFRNYARPQEVGVVTTDLPIPRYSYRPVSYSYQITGNPSSCVLCTCCLQYNW